MARIPIPASPFPQEVIVIIDDAIADMFDVRGVPFPKNLPRKWNDPEDNNREKRINWVNNFQLVKKTTTTGKIFTYSVELDQSEGKLVVFDGARVFAPPVSPVTSLQEGMSAVRVQAVLTAVDPAIGWG